MMFDQRTVRRSLFVFLGLLIAAAAANALAYAATTAGWVPTSDNWFYLERVVYPYAHGHFDPSALLVKRNAFDHSQPLRRLLLLANYEWFNLDLRVEAIFAVVVGIGNILLLGFAMRNELRAGREPAWVQFAALAAVYFSLSSTIVFTWSLVTLSFTTHTILFLWVFASWATLQAPGPGRAAMLCVATFLFGLVADDTALVAFVALTMASAIHAMRGRNWYPALVQASASATGLAAYLLFYRAFAPAADAGSGLGAVTGLFHARVGDIWQWMAVPLVSALVHMATLREWFGAWADSAVLPLALAFALAHVWFWKQAFAGASNRVAYLSVVLMLLFYGLVAGILVSRVSEYGVRYLWQPRYAVIYRWHLLALLMMLIAQSGAMRQGGRTPRLATSVAALLVLLQVPLGVSAWKDAKYVRNAGANMAAQVEEMGNSPTGEPSRACLPQLTVCKFPAARRQRVIGFLRQQRLSVFSPEVRERNDYPGVGP
jgi:hypothetical protein